MSSPARTGSPLLLSLAKDLKKYPVSFQTPTYVEFSIREDDEEGGEEDSQSGRGGNSDSKASAKKPLKSFESFSRTVEGEIPDLAEIKKLVLDGKGIRKRSAWLGAKHPDLIAQIKSISFISL
jgi:hypothetical protein